MYKQLEYFIKVVELNSFTKAAEEMYISQSAISQQVKLLEEQLGVELLERKNRSFTLAHAGQYLYREAKVLLSNTNEIINKTKEIANVKQNLRIGYLRNVDDTILFDAVLELSKRRKNLSISMKKGTHDELYDDLVGESINIALNDQRREFNQEYENNILREIKLSVLVADNHPIASKEKIDMEELSDMKCILVTPKDQKISEKDYYINYLGVKSSFMIAGDRDQALKLLQIENAFYLDPCHKEIEGIKAIPAYMGNRRLIMRLCTFYSKYNDNEINDELTEILLEKYAEIED